MWKKYNSEDTYPLLLIDLYLKNTISLTLHYKNQWFVVFFYL